MLEPVTIISLKKAKIAKDKIQIWIKSKLTLQEWASVSAHNCSGADCICGSKAKRKDANIKDLPESNHGMKQEQPLWKYSCSPLKKKGENTYTH